MSNTGSALQNVRLLADRGDERGVLRWGEKALDYLREDLTLPPHVQGVRTKKGVELHCRKCEGSVPIPSLAHAAHFRDRHWHCGDERAPAWFCPYCKRWGFEWESNCRFCKAPHASLRVEERSVAELLDQRARFEVMSLDRKELFQITCNAQRTAWAAAKAVWPGSGLLVRGPL